MLQVTEIPYLGIQINSKQLFLVTFLRISENKGTLLLNENRIFAPTLYTVGFFKFLFMRISVSGYAETI